MVSPSFSSGGSEVEKVNEMHDIYLSTLGDDAVDYMDAISMAKDGSELKIFLADRLIYKLSMLEYELGNREGDAMISKICDDEKRISDMIFQQKVPCVQGTFKNICDVIYTFNEFCKVTSPES